MSRVPQIELQQCTGLEKGKPPAQQPYYGDGAALYLTPEYLRGAAIACESVKPSTNAVRVDSGDTILLWDGSNAGEVMRGRPGILASTMSRVNHDDRFLPPYFFYALKRWEAHLKGQTSGSGIPHVDKEILGRLTITEFERPEQSMIAEVLATVDRAIEQTEALIAKQRRIKTGLMQDLLTRGIDEHGTLRSEATHKFRDSPLGRIPAEWDEKHLDDCVEFWDGKRVPLKQADRDEMPGDFPYYGASGIIDYIDKYIFNDDLILVGEDGENVVSRNLPLAFMVSGKIWVNNHAHVLKPKDGFNIEFLTNRLEYYDYTLLVSGSAQPKLNQRNLRQMELPMPSSAEQNQIGDVMVAHTNRCDQIVRNAAKLRRLKTGLMQDLLTGKRRVKTLMKSSPEVSAL